MAINAGPRRGVNITGFFRQQNMLVLVLVVHALLAVACYCKAEEVDQSLTEFAEVKRKLKPDSSLEDWRKVRDFSMFQCRTCSLNWSRISSTALTMDLFFLMPTRRWASNVVRRVYYLEL